MTIIELLKREYEAEALTTRKMLSVVPNDKWDWKPHEKSMTLRSLTGHIAELPSWITMTFTTDELDFATSPYQQPKLDSNKDLMDLFEKHLVDGRKELKEENTKLLDKPWTLRNGEIIYNTSPKIDVIRMSLSQIIHHRAQLGVFLRLLNIPIPGSYGPSADDQSM
ncbi:MAG: damage-inducible protein DinB [Bacteroidetes bacterium]|jgi:uncharacterized damage-inducible protein DinB|nr:damage-inducible protein DinB [Bacteroidota bacterium]